ncbi:flagellar motor protein MotB [Marinomonas rhizomae]|uniref:OOP family OmpA-OmpF porin n=1 Tax=Marinomonas rhizomae TaxID=491948 RepID=A0A366J9R3_9GAMM|nr:OmpA family protein [Marinomonas rhizomae]RBP83776.1 OOP family OmpA-OmpF porin [Marinomonas rhizomae]RNF73511.1 flagellar motor protein MotB [Marinomonas rhizomae]
MSFNIAKRTLLSSIIAASSISTLALAQQQEGFTLTPSIGYYNMDSDRDTKDDKAYSLGLGYQFNNPWAVEFVYLNADTTQSGGGNDVDVDQYRIDGLYHLPDVSPLNLTPYLAAGVGTADFSNGGNNNTLVNAGGGLKYAINDTVSLRADFRLVDDVEDHHLDNVTSLGVQMTFGGSSSNSTPSTNDSIEAYEQSYTQAEPEPAVQPPQTEQAEVINSEPVEQVQEEPMATSPMTEEAPQQPEIVAEPPGKINIQFGLNKTNVEQKYYPEIEKVAIFLKENPNSTVIIEGHTDDSGAASYNQKLSEKRAQAIAEVLTNTFEISDTRVESIGYGEERPFVENDTEAHREANRRVVAIISTSEE